MIRRTSKEILQVQVGVFLALGILLTMVAIFMLGSKSSFFKNFYTLYCEFDDISGLRVGSPVQLAGVQVGTVEEINFVEVAVKVVEKEAVSRIEGKSASEDPSLQGDRIVKVRVKLSIDTSYKERIRDDSMASVVTQGLLGDRMVYITAGVSKRILGDGDRVERVFNPTGFSSLVQRGDDLLLDARGSLADINKFVTNLNDVLTEIKDGEGLVHELIYGKSSRRTLNQVELMIDNLARTSKDFASISNKIDSGQGTVGSLINDAALYNDLRMLLGKANRNRLIKSVIQYTLKTREKEQLKSK